MFVWYPVVKVFVYKQKLHFSEFLFALQIETKKLDFNVQSKVGSLDNVKHKPKGGDKKIFDDKEYLKQMSGISSENHSLSGSQVIY